MDEHPFTPLLRTVARGPNLSRPLARAEARRAMDLILSGSVAPEQLGAFLLVLRVRGETAAELAGFVDATRHHVMGGAGALAADLDWPTYADRHRQQPWFVLAALTLAGHGVRVLMHGIPGDSEGYAPTPKALEALAIAPCASPDVATRHLAESRFAYLPLSALSPPLERLFALRPLLGVRTVVNTLARALNPFEAPCQVQGVFHPPYQALHRDAALMLGQPSTVIFKGGGGEAQRNPLKPCLVAWVRHGTTGEDEWPALTPNEAFDWRGEPLEPARVAALWRGEIKLPQPEAAIIGTVALALWALGRTSSPAEAHVAAERMWRDRAGIVRPAA